MEFWHCTQTFYKRKHYPLLVIVDRSGTRNNHFQIVLMTQNKRLPLPGPASVYRTCPGGTITPLFSSLSHILICGPTS